MDYIRLNEEMLQLRLEQANQCEKKRKLTISINHGDEGLATIKLKKLLDYESMQ